MWELVKAGGYVMWPIILCSIAAAAIFVERLWTLQASRVLPKELTRKVLQWIETRDLNDKMIAALEQNSPLGKVIAVGLANRNRPRDVLVERVADTGRHVVHELERFIGMLGTIASIAPLLGLLGTVTGIIRAFNDLALKGGGDPRILSGGIAEALITTAAGLLVAIPALVGYRYLRGRVEGLVVEMEKEAMQFVEFIELQKSRG
ncbi:MAG: MotA/TolQ/ExbB proton channel family protein [Steroidobacterales bacterium]